MTALPPPGQPRAEPPRPENAGNAQRSQEHSPEDIAEQVPGPDHGSVAVFQAPQPIRPRTNGTPAPVDPMDIDSPFLDLFSGTVPQPSTAPPPDDPDADFDFGFDFDGEDARRSTPAPPAAEPPATRPVSGAPEAALPVQPVAPLPLTPPVSAPSTPPALPETSVLPAAAPGIEAGKEHAAPAPDVRTPGFERAPVGPQADYFDERDDAGNLGRTGRPDDHRPDATPQPTTATTQAPFWQQTNGSPPAPGVHPTGQAPAPAPTGPQPTTSPAHTSGPQPNANSPQTAGPRPDIESSHAPGPRLAGESVSRTGPVPVAEPPSTADPQPFRESTRPTVPLPTGRPAPPPAALDTGSLPAAVPGVHPVGAVLDPTATPELYSMEPVVGAGLHQTDPVGPYPVNPAATGVYPTDAAGTSAPYPMNSAGPHAYPGNAVAEPERHAELAPMPEKAPAKQREKAPAKQRRKRKEPDNLPAIPRKDVKPAPLRPHKLKFSDRDPAIELEISEIAGHLTFTQSTVTAWYYLPEVRWAFRPDAEREALLSAISEQYAGLAGFRLHLRRTNRPFPADEWARTVDSLTAKPLPDVTGGTSWSDHLVAAQRHLLSVNHAEGQTYLGVTFARRSLGDTFSERILRIFGRGTSDNERRKLGRTVEQFDEVLNAFGMRGRRVTPTELEWLLFRSVALCMAPPGPLSPVSHGHWERGDLLALTEQVERYRTPYGSTVKLVNRMTGEERHVAVLSVGRMEPLEIPEKHEPWMHFHERLPWPMELSSRLDILGSNSSFKNLEHRLRMIRSQQLDYAEHGIDAPPELERLAKRALVIGDEMTTGLPVESARAHGWHRIAVGGRTREECLERARRLIQLYSRELRISLQHPKNQDQLAREFIPGEPIANTGYVRRMPVKLLAAALPQAASTVGDRRGDLIGRTAGTCRRPVFLDLHFPMEVRERSGLGVFVAEPGGGKSTLMGALGYLNARRGVQVTLLDPSGPLARLCQMPELRPYSRVLNLTGSEQGTLAPYALIPTPVRTEFATGPSGDREYEIAVSNARAERRMLVQDICSMLVPPQVAKEASTATLLRHAVRQVPAEETSTLDDVVATLQGLDDDEGKELANLLLDTAEMPLALLFFGRPPQHLLGADAALTVITMAGLRLPDLKIEREYWSAEESLALPMLHTAHRLAVRRCYGGSMASRKMVGLDEAHFMEGWRSGRSFLVRLARDSRKWNLAALVASQNPRDILGLDVQNLVSTVFVGRIAEDQEIASEALRLLRVPVHDGYEATLASLSQADTSSSFRLGFREFVMRDVDGRVQKVRVDVSYVDGLLDHLDTTPAAAKAAPTAIPTFSDLEA
ncbi:ATP-binding protein [Actinoplanes sp. NPDC051859]|uniref:ATP-binding protein n=1 Tax=Actinoplanes sp. NPDC051859 TaxID=3363909 RepID=UPI0037ADFC19